MHCIGCTAAECDENIFTFFIQIYSDIFVCQNVYEGHTLRCRYKRRIRRSNIKIVEAPVRALIPASLPPGSYIHSNSSHLISSFFIQFIILSFSRSDLLSLLKWWVRFNNGSTRSVTDGRGSLRAGGTVGHWQQWQVKLYGITIWWTITCAQCTCRKYVYMGILMQYDQEICVTKL